MRHGPEAVNGLRPSGGGDFSEGVGVALGAALSPQRRRWREKSRVAVIVVGDDGPDPKRAEKLMDRIRATCKGNSRVRVHCLQVNLPRAPAGGQDFWRNLASAGGGRHVPLEPLTQSVYELCSAVPSGLDPVLLRRVVHLAMRLEEGGVSR